MLARLNPTLTRLFSTLRASSQKLTYDVNDPEKVSHVFVAKDLDKRPVENVPFVKSLFKGTFEKVSQCFTV